MRPGKQHGYDFHLTGTTHVQCFDNDPDYPKPETTRRYGRGYQARYRNVGRRDLDRMLTRMCSVSLKLTADGPVSDPEHYRLGSLIRADYDRIRRQLKRLDNSFTTP